MSKIAFVTDSIACLPSNLVILHGIEVIPITLLSKGKVYRDWVDMNPSQAYEIFLKDPDTFKTAPATPEDCYETLHSASRRAQQIVCITASTQISTLFNVVHAAADKFKQDNPGARVEVVDSETATAAEGFVVLAAAAAAEKGLELDDVLKAANQVKARVNVIALLDTVKYVYRSGRVPRIAAQAGSILNIKPIFTIRGSVHFATAAVSRRTGIERILKMMKEKVGNKPIHCAVMHAYDLLGADGLMKRVKAEFNCLELWVTEFSPVMGYATGAGTLGLAFYVDIKNEGNNVINGGQKE
jgi:DegV family protein with EDD domain